MKRMSDTFSGNDNEELIFELRSENDRLKRRLEEYEEGEDEARKKIEALYRDAERKNAQAQYAYATELKAMKSFSDKWRNYFSSTAQKAEKSEIIDLLRAFLSDVGISDAKETAQKIEKTLNEKANLKAAPTDKSDEEDGYKFDLDAVMNPTEDLDLTELCVELGVYRGDSK
ncbi:MAG: hypothetical protein J5762_03695 [Clostridia bacterium]|nr:hypothetical protein [Clostridia bacterium]